MVVHVNKTNKCSFQTLLMMALISPTNVKHLRNFPKCIWGAPYNGEFIPPKKENRSYAYICQTQCCNMPTLQRFIYYKYPLIISLDFGHYLSPAVANFKSLGWSLFEFFSSAQFCQGLGNQQNFKFSLRISM
jgi:hypothetical protein